MREIKFRAWDKEEEMMLNDVSLQNETWDMMNELFRNEDSLSFMQYTGLKDVNCVEIYEGDIVKRTHLFNGGYGETHTGEVVYDKEYARYVISKPQTYTEPKTEDIRNTLSDKSTYEVIGNIYENPELLEREAE